MYKVKIFGTVLDTKVKSRVVERLFVVYMKSKMGVMKRILVIILIGILIIQENLLADELMKNAGDSFSVSYDQPLLAIYPNPTSEYLNIAQTQFDGSISQLEIIDLSGHTMYSINEKFTQLSIYVGNWRKGLYMVIFHQGNNEVMHKIQVQ